MLVVVLILLFILIPAAVAGVMAAPWVPTWGRDIGRVLKLLPSKKGTSYVELGFGTGTVLLSVARARPDMRIVGYEIQPILFLLVWLRVRLGGYENVEVKLGDFFRADLSFADVVFLYWTEKTAHKIYDLRLEKGTRVISYAFEIPKWKLGKVDEKKGSLSIFVYDLD